MIHSNNAPVWGLFPISEIFEKINPEKIKGKAADFPSKPTGEYCVPLLTASVQNLGLSRFAKREQCPTILINVLTVAEATDGTAFFQTEPFAVLQSAYAITPKDCNIPDETIGLFLQTCLNQSFIPGNFNWSNRATFDKIKHLYIALPITESAAPDWDYMEQYIRELEQDRIRELEQYLMVTGLNDYELTEEDKEILHSFNQYVEEIRKAV